MRRFYAIAVVSLTAATFVMVGEPVKPVNAAAPRSSWVVNELYTFNRNIKLANSSQLTNELATKMSKMSTGGAFAFFRGTAHLFYKDMVALPASKYTSAATNVTWLEGDMHLQNMGGLRDSSNNDVFDTSDFDEGYFGPYVWDVRRMAVSIILAAKENGIGSSDRQKLVQNFVDSYLTALDGFRGNDSEKTYRLTTSNTSGVVKDTIQSAAGKSRSSFLTKYTTVSSSKRTFVTASDFQPVTSSTYSAIKTALSGYINSIAVSKRYSTSFYTLKDVRLKLGSGVGSLGRYRYYLLIEGPTTSTSDDVILEMKQEMSSAVAIAAPGQMPFYVYGNHEGQRVTTTMKAMLNNTDVLAGYTTVNGQPYFLREKSPYQEDFDYTKLTSYDKFNTAVGYMGKIVAKNHALADQDYDAGINSYSEDKQILDAVSSKSGFKTEILNFAVDYAAQVEYDYASFNSAYTSGQTLY